MSPPAAARPRVVLLEPMYHPAGMDALRGPCELVVLEHPVDPATLEAALAGAHALAPRYPHRVDDALLARAPKLVVVACSGRGTDAVDLEAATRRGVAVVNNPGFGRRPVSETAIALMLALAKRIVPSDRFMREGVGWRHRTDYERFVDLDGRTLGVVGMGEIGTETARKAIAAFSMRVLAYDPHVPRERIEAVGAHPVGHLDELLRAADVVSLHPELNEETRGMIGDRELGLMKPTAFLVNTSRGKVVRQDALARALREGRIAGAALDVYEDEPVGADSPLIGLDGIVLTPHVAGLSADAVRGMSLSTARQVLQALSGRRPDHLLDPRAWDAAAGRAAGLGFRYEGEWP
ncbi:MAG TPA: hydroxyacid dehydrogenase [Burkholderiaceae bacterium]|nr:hydroxyacid dehydrogenase [Burkholderiaceae bacterium]